MCLQKKGGNVKVIPPYRPVGANDSPEGSPVKETEPTKTTSKRKLSENDFNFSSSVYTKKFLMFFWWCV